MKSNTGKLKKAERVCMIIKQQINNTIISFNIKQRTGGLIQLYKQQHDLFNLIEILKQK